MPADTKEGEEQIDLLRSLPLDDSTEEKVETLWRQLMVYKSFAANDLSDAKARRAQAEVSREQAELESIKATKLLCDRMKSEAARELEDAQKAKSEALRAKERAEDGLAKAHEERARLDKEHDSIVAKAQQRAEEILQQARATAQQESTELRRQALKEIRTVLSRVENMREAVNEEMETQRILSNVARLKSSARWAINREDNESAGDNGTEDGGQQATQSEAGPAAPADILAPPSAEVRSPEPAAASPKSSDGKKTRKS